MRRRKYLQAAGLALASGLAGCNDRGGSDDSTPTAAPTTTPTETPTPTEEPTPTRDDQTADPPGFTPPLWMRLLPRTHLANESGESSSGFLRMDWKWYLKMRTISPDWGPADDEDWTFAPTKENEENPPSADILKTPTWGAYLASYNIEDVVFDLFPNLGPELKRQCGLAADEGRREDARVIDEVMTYADPQVTMLIGADTDAVRDALSDSQKLADGPPDNYKGAGEASSRGILVSDHWSRGVVMVETAGEKAENLKPAGKRLVGEGESVVAEPSLRWAASAVDLGLSPGAGAPVVTGEMGGSQFDTIWFGRTSRGVVPLEPFDALLTTLGATPFAGTVQHAFAHVDGEPPTADELRGSFETESGEWTASSRANVSSIEAAWE